MKTMNALKMFPIGALNRWPLTSLLSISSDYCKEMVAHSRPTEHRPKMPALHTLLYYLYLGGHLVRLPATALILNVDYPLQADYYYYYYYYLRYDLLLDLFVKLHFIDGKLAIVLWPAVLLLIYFDYTVHFRRGLFSFHLVHDLMVVNR